MKRAFKRNYLKPDKNISSFFSKSANDCDLRVSGIFSMLEEACSTFCTRNAVKIALKRHNITNGKEITLNLRQNLRMIAICLRLENVGKRDHYFLHVK